MSIYIGNDLEDRLEALKMEKTSLKKYNLEDRLKALKTENALLKKYNEYHQFVYEIDHMSDLHLDSSFCNQSMDIDNYFKIKKWYDSSIDPLTVIQQLDKKRPKLSNLNQTQNRRNKTNDLILNLTPENVTQHSSIVTTTRKGSSIPTKMSKIIGRQIQ